MTIRYFLEDLFKQKRNKYKNMKPAVWKKGHEAIKKRNIKSKMSTADKHEEGEKVFSAMAEKGLYKLKKVSRDYQVPYLAGYSRDRSTIYIDCDALKGYKENGVFCDADKYWVIHESVEDAMEQAGASYDLGHALGTLAEERAVQDDGFDVDKYNDFCKQEIEKAGNRKEYTNLPSDLDMRPYLAQPENVKLLKKMGYLGG